VLACSQRCTMPHSCSRGTLCETPCSTLRTATHRSLRSVGHTRARARVCVCAWHAASRHRNAGSCARWLQFICDNGQLSGGTCTFTDASITITTATGSSGTAKTYGCVAMHVLWRVLCCADAAGSHAHASRAAFVWWTMLSCQTCSYGTTSPTRRSSPRTPGFPRQPLYWTRRCR
jgi:hypothetical protein